MRSKKYGKLALILSVLVCFGLAMTGCASSKIQQLEAQVQEALNQSSKAMSDAQSAKDACA
ncbi:MAG: hypothetical protein RBR01_00965, partial [Desulfobacterales bacterium]|nr:hypothetical protein [Desulfobacterales bacterium]